MVNWNGLMHVAYFWAAVLITVVTCCTVAAGLNYICATYGTGGVAAIIGFAYFCFVSYLVYIL